ncbi:MAG: nicotinate-nucleotide adenylyltransferase [Planctomycetota bacterium]|nr:nicotinate-nucleotide adenylyltransferase [Planctomycetota bacterium]
MRLGILGGTFDPVHNGHLLLAERCREECRLDRVAFLPAGIPPHKLTQSITDGNSRAEMLSLAIVGRSEFVVDRRELKRTEPCFTVATLAELREEDPDRELVFLMGADSLADFPKWKAPGRILELAEIAVVNRGGAPIPDLSPLIEQFGASATGRVQIVTIPGIEIASRDIRERVRLGKSIRYLVPRAVECYIAEHRLYS